MKKLKDLCLKVLINEGEEVFSLTPSEVGSVVDVDIIDDDIKIKFETSYDKEAYLVVKLSDFKNWAAEKNQSNAFRLFVIDFLENSTETDEGLNEIVDDDGNIDLDDSMPSNATNGMVTSPKFDLEKIFKSFVPKSLRFYAGDLGMGSVVWE